MKLSLAITAGLLLLGVLSGCISMKAYVDPQLRLVSYSDLSNTSKGPSLGVLVAFQRDGESYPAVTGDARNTILRVLKKTTLFSSVSSGIVNTEAQLNIVINNTGGETKGSGYATGFSFGAVGTRTLDRYIITAVYEVEGAQPITKEYRHAIHATVGNARGPKGLKSMTVSDAFDVVVEQVVLLFLYDLQQEGIL